MHPRSDRAQTQLRVHGRVGGDGNDARHRYARGVHVCHRERTGSPSQSVVQCRGWRPTRRGTHLRGQWTVQYGVACTTADAVANVIVGTTPTPVRFSCPAVRDSMMVGSPQFRKRCRVSAAIPFIERRSGTLARPTAQHPRLLAPASKRFPAIARLQRVLDRIGPKLGVALYVRPRLAGRSRPSGSAPVGAEGTPSKTDPAQAPRRSVCGARRDWCRPVP